MICEIKSFWILGIFPLILSYLEATLKSLKDLSRHFIGFVLVIIGFFIEYKASL
jgi:hypothetical protein